MANEIEVVISGKDNTSSSFDSAKKSADEYGSSIDGAGEKADEGERRFLGLKDTIDGVGAVMQGPHGKQGLGGFVQGLADLSGGIANFVVPSLKSAWKGMVSLGTATGRAALMASIQRGASIAGAVATRIMTVAQRGLNAAMRANPIGIVITVLALLVAGLIYAYRHSATFRRIVQAAWAGIKAAAAAAWAGIKVVFRFLVRAFETYIDSAKSAGRWLRSVWNSITSAISGAVGRIRGAFSAGISYIQGRWSALVSFVRGIPGKIRAVFAGARSWLANAGRSLIQGFINGAKSIASSAGGAIMSAARAVIPDALEKYIPGFAHGGIVGARAAGGGPRGGRVLVGEGGPELVDLPYGSMVHSNANSRRMSTAGGPSITVNAYSNADPFQIAHEIAWILKTSGR